MLCIPKVIAGPVLEEEEEEEEEGENVRKFNLNRSQNKNDVPAGAVFPA